MRAGLASFANPHANVPHSDYNHGKSMPVFGQADTISGHSYPAISVGGNATVQLGDQHQHFYQTPAADQQSLNYELLLTSLSFPRMHARQRNVGIAMPRTCDWFFESTSYLDWIDDMKMSEHFGFLWLKGKPGSGKSTIMKRTLQQVVLDKPQYLIVSYFFNARSTSDLEKSSIGLYRSVVHQILSACPDVRNDFTQKFVFKIHQGNVEDEWSIAELQQYLIELVQMPSNLRVIFLIDALDEGDVKDVRQMVAFLEDLTQHAGLSGNGNIVRVCLSSRHYPYITIKKGMSLTLEDQHGHSEDISKYIENKLIVEESEAEQPVRLAVQSKSSQIFLWVVLVIPILNEMHDAGCETEELLEYLETLPDELHGLFRNVVLKDRVTVRNAVILFQWLLFAQRPLSPQELYAAIKLGIGASTSGHNMPDDSVVKRFLLQSSRGLVEIVETRSDRSMPIDAAVQFIHESVRDFLVKRQELVDLDARLSGNMLGISHDVLKECCYAQLKQFTGQDSLSPVVAFTDETDESSVIIKDGLPLIRYTAEYLFVHSAVAQQNGLCQREFLERFTMNEDKHGSLPKWIQLGRFPAYSAKDDVIHDDASLLFTLIVQSPRWADQRLFHTLFEVLLKITPNLDSVGGSYGNVLHMACTLGIEYAVRRLIENGANIDTLGGVYENALMAALLGTSEEVVNMVASCRAQTSTELLKKVLLSVVRRGRCGWAELVISQGLNALMFGPDDVNPLNVAISVANADCVRLLLDHGFSFSEDPLRQMTGLSLKPGHVEITELLANRGVRLNLHYGQELFERAMSHRRFDLAKVLFDNDALLKDFELFDATCLGAAAEDHGNVEQVQWLIDRGVDVNARDVDGESALEKAVRSVNRRAIGPLLDGGADPKFASTALTTAVSYDMLDLVKLLLDHGAEVNPLPTWSKSALSDASSLEIVRILVEHGADVNFICGNKGTILHHFIESNVKDSTEIVKFLISHGAKVNPKLPHPYRTPLQLAVGVGRLHLIEILLANGAETDVFCPPNERLLRQAVKEKCSMAVDFLLKQTPVTTAIENVHGPPISSYQVDGLEFFYVENEDQVHRLYGADEDKYGNLPSGWEILYNSSGTPFYVDHNSHMTTWDRPVTTELVTSNDRIESNIDDLRSIEELTARTAAHKAYAPGA